MDSRAILIGIVAVLSIFGGSYSAYAQSTIYLACAAPPDQIPAPSNGTSLNYAVINNGNVDFSESIPDNTWGNARGWNPDGTLTFFTVGGVSSAAQANPNSVIALSTNDDESWNVCGANFVTEEFLEAANVTKGNMTSSQ